MLPMPWCSEPVATAMPFICRPTPRGVTSPPSGARTNVGPLLPILFTQIHPTCIPVTGEHQSKLTLMSESLRNDGRIWVPNEDTPSPTGSPLRIAITFSSAHYELQQPGAA